MTDPKTLEADLAAQQRASIGRRHFLRGAGVCLALPALESLLPTQAFAAAAQAAARTRGAATTATGAPLRTAFIYFPNGAIQTNWWPRSSPT
ncbi:MAG: hypothetical protein V4671_28925, partial [Armatimonadota bacterium]